jgi:hypothetical protein
MCTAREMQNLLEDLAMVQNSSNGKVTRLASRIFEELNDPMAQVVCDLDCYSKATRSLKLAEDNCRSMADWFRKARMDLLRDAPVQEAERAVAVGAR